MSGCRYVSDCRSRGCKFDPGAVQTFVQIDLETFSKTILLPSADSFKKGCNVSCKQNYVHIVLVNCLVKLAQEKSVVR